MHKTDIGNIAENQAVSFIKSQNMIILETNFRALPYGEIDIIAIDGADMVFIEVKFRSYDTFGSAEGMVSKAKQQKIINAANIYLQENTKYDSYNYRFDVIAINKNDLKWIKSAFDAF